MLELGPFHVSTYQIAFALASGYQLDEELPELKFKAYLPLVVRRQTGGKD
jgi:hypothetical protein